MAEKVTMVLEVNLECHRCYKKVNKILSKFCEIHDPKYDEKQNTVTITVVSCRPEKIQDKLYRKGKGFIRCIKIIPPKKDIIEEKKKEGTGEPQEKKKEKENTGGGNKKEAMIPTVYQVGICLVPYCEGYGGRGRCNHGYGIRPCPSLGPCYDGCRCGCGGVIRPYRPCYDGCGCGCGGSRFYVNEPCDRYFCEEDQRCTIM